MGLTAKNVHEVLCDCLFPEMPKEPTEVILVEGAIHKFGLNPVKIEEKKEDISSMLDQLPDVFKQGKGDGMSFLSACERKDGIQWAEHRNIEELLCLGLASGKAKFCLEDRKDWAMFPGGMPYFMILTEAVKPKTVLFRDGKVAEEPEKCV